MVKYRTSSVQTRLPGLADMGEVKFIRASASVCFFRARAVFVKFKKNLGELCGPVREESTFHGFLFLMRRSFPPQIFDGPSCKKDRVR